MSFCRKTTVAPISAPDREGHLSRVAHMFSELPKVLGHELAEQRHVNRAELAD
jgi:hypothetical protein